MTAAPELFDLELEQMLDLELCVARDGVATHVYVHHDCERPMCAHHVEVAKRNIASVLAGRAYGLYCEDCGTRGIQPSQITIRPI